MCNFSLKTSTRSSKLTKLVHLQPMRALASGKYTKIFTLKEKRKTNVSLPKIFLPTGYIVQKKCKQSRYNNKESLDCKNDILGFHSSLRVVLFDFKYDKSKCEIKTQYNGVQS